MTPVDFGENRGLPDYGAGYSGSAPLKVFASYRDHVKNIRQANETGELITDVLKPKKLITIQT